MSAWSYEYFDERRAQRAERLEERQAQLEGELLVFHRRAGADKQAWKNDEEVGKAYTAARGLVACNHELKVLRLQRLLVDRARGREHPGDSAEIERLERELDGRGRPGTAELEEEGETARKRLDALLKVLVDVQPAMADRIEQTWQRFEREADLNGGSAIVHLVRWEKQTGGELERLLAPLLAGDDAG